MAPTTAGLQLTSLMMAIFQVFPPILDKVDSNDRDDQAWRVSFAWQPSDSTRLDVSAYHSESDTNGVLSRGLDGDLTLPFPLHPSNYTHGGPIETIAVTAVRLFIAQTFISL